MYNILRLLCEHLKSIGVKLTEIWSCKSPPLRSDFELQRTFKSVFLALSFFRVSELSSSKSTAQILLDFYTLFLHINYEVTLSSFFFILTYFKITKFPIFLMKNQYFDI